MVNLERAAHRPVAARLGPREVGEPMYKVEGDVVRGNVLRLEKRLERAEEGSGRRLGLHQPAVVEAELGLR